MYPPPERKPPVALPSVPGDYLATVIADLAAVRDLPLWDLDCDYELHHGRLVAPRMPEFPRGGQATAHAKWSVPHAREVLRPRLALALESDDDLAWEVLDTQDVADLTKLRAAATRDIAGVSGEQLTEALVYTDESTTRATVREGRKMLRELGAWPWCAFDEKGRPPHSWWKDGDRVAHALLGWWVSPDLLSWAGDALADLD